MVFHVAAQKFKLFLFCMSFRYCILYVTPKKNAAEEVGRLAVLIRFKRNRC